VLQRCTGTLADENQAEEEKKTNKTNHYYVMVSLFILGYK
jgi:hypothetical protein